MIIQLDSGASGILPVANGGTGASTTAEALSNLLPSGATEGDALIKTSSGYGWGEAGGGMLPTLHITAATGTSVIAKKGDLTVSGSTGTSGTCVMDVPERGSWVVTVGSNSTTIAVEHCSDYYYDFTTTIMGIARSTSTSATTWSRTDAAKGLSATASVGSTAGSSDFDDMPIYKDITRVTLSTGDIMVKIPKFWYQRYIDTSGDGLEHIRIANNASEGFTIHPAFYRNGTTYDCIYVGAYKTTTGHTSKSGLAPLVSLTRAAFRTGARAKGTGWGIIDLATLSAIQMLILVEFADNHVQEMIGAGNSSTSAAIKTGTCDAVPNLTGRPAGTATAVDVVWRGIESFWGNVWEWTDGVNWNGGTYYISNNPSVYADDTSTGYTTLGYSGNTGWSGSYITTIGIDSNNSWAMLPSVAGSGSASTYYADGVWSSTGWRVFIHGGRWDNGGLCGLFASNLGDASSSASAYYGARLQHLPS